MTERDGHGVRGVMGLGWRLETEQQLHHLLDLGLLCPAVPHNRQFDFGRRVLDQRQVRLTHGEQRDTTRVSQLKGRASVFGMEQVLNRDTRGLRLGEQAFQMVMNEVEAVGEHGPRRGRNRAATDKTMPGAVGLDAPITCARRARIDPEDSHASEASMSFSSKSALVQTLRVSSQSSSASMSFIICCTVLPSRAT